MKKIELTDEEKEIKANSYFKLLKENAIGRKVVVHRFHAGFEEHAVGVLLDVNDYENITIKTKSEDKFTIPFIYTWGGIASIYDYANQNKVYYNYEGKVTRSIGSGSKAGYNLYMKDLYGNRIENKYHIKEETEKQEIEQKAKTLKKIK